MATTPPLRQADEYAAQDEWLKAVMEHRKVYNSDRRNVEYRSRLEQAELTAAEYYYVQGKRLRADGQGEAAATAFQHGLAAKPEHEKLQHALGELMASREAGSLYDQAMRLSRAGHREEASRLLQQALEIYPAHTGASMLLLELEADYQRSQASDAMALTSDEPITLNFRQTELRTAFEFIVRSFGINVIFDEGVKNERVTLFAQDMSFTQALDLLTKTSKTFYRRVGNKTIIVASDTAEKRGQYEDYLVRTFFLNSIQAREMNDILKGVMNVRNITVNERMNALIVRDTEEHLKQIGRLVEANDRKPAEMLLEVEILEVNQAKAQRLGLDFGSYQIGASIPSSVTVGLTDSIRGAYKSFATLSLPSVMFRFYKQDVDAKVLANPRIRVINARPAKIHIGDRVPLRASTITDATGQVRTSYDYREIGIRLIVEPVVNLDNTVTVRLELEVSTLGENIGTAEEAAYRIGTRNAETVMLLRDGETAILGGLIRDEDRQTGVKLPLLGDLPAIGRLFTSSENTSGRTDVLLTITPRVVRGWDIPSRDLQQFFSGNAERYTSGGLFAPAPPGPGRAAAPRPPSAAGVPAPDAVPEPGLQAVPGPQFRFAQSVYEVDTGKEFEVLLHAHGMAEMSGRPIEVTFNPQAVEVNVEAEQEFDAYRVEVDGNNGLLRLIPLRGPDTAARADDEQILLSRLTIRAKRAGVSYLVYRVPEGEETEYSNVQLQSARVLAR